MKKNQIALVLLTIITMVAVWYFKTPTINNEKNDEIQVVVASKSTELSNMRENVKKQRYDSLMHIYDVLADETVSAAAKTAALDERDYLSSLFDAETILEEKIINLGYVDAFAHYSSNGVEIIAISHNATAEDVLKIIDVVNESFEKCDNIVVSFTTNEELSKA